MGEDRQDGFQYDRVAYPGAADGVINLRNLEVMSAMFGLKGPALADCRVLELGCADGTNILPFAAEFPESHFVAVDLAEERIAEAQHTATQLGLVNIEFRRLNIADLADDIGQFDYILCPGVYSWVTERERKAILRICRDHLAENGVAAISFNVLPGWNYRGSVRELIRRHVRFFDDPQQQITEARKVIEFVAQNTSDETPHGLTYAKVLESIRCSTDHYVFHDYISDRSQAFYFHEFAGQVEDTQLQYIADADITFSAAMSLSKEARGLLNRTPLAEREQLLDFLENTSYRRAMLCRKDAAVNRAISFQSLDGLSISLKQAFDDLTFDPADREPLKLEIEGASLTTTEPLGKAALKCLMSAWPQVIPVNQLYRLACQQLPDELHSPPPDQSGQQSDGATTMGRAMLAAFAAGLVRVVRTVPQLASTVSEKPVATALARYCAAHDRSVVSQWHQGVGPLHTDEACLLSLLDGTRDVSQLSAELDKFRQGLKDHDTAGARLELSVDEILRKFAREFLVLLP